MKTLAAVLSENLSKPIKKLSFEDIELEFNEIPDEIIELKKLELLNLGKLPITRKSLLKLKNLTNLKEVKILNYTSSDFPLSLMEIKSLTKLTIFGDSIRNLPVELNAWDNLGYLNVTGCSSLSEVKGIPGNLNYLNISDTSIAQIPARIYSLKFLRKFVASGLNLNKIPEEIFKMTSLESLFLPNNKLKSIPKKIWRLKNLEELYIYNNLFSSFPLNIANIEKLVELDLSENALSNLPDSIFELKNLKKINLRDNEFIDFPKALISLNKIENINLSNVFNRNEKGNKVRIVPEEIISCEGLKILNLENNPVENVPSEIVSKGYDAIKNFFQSKIEADKEEFLFEAKMVVVGRGNVGKTVLTKKLIDPAYVLDKSDTTFGIKVLRNPFITQLTIDNLEINFKLNIWDFGGQEKYDATHQLFITKRSIYLFLTEAREESNYLDFYFWLNTIQLFSDNSPTVIVLSKCDERKKTLPESLYKENFDNIVEFVDVSCAPGYEFTIENLKQALNKAIYSLPQTKLKLSNRWIDIRNSIENLSKERDYITYKEYLDICQQNQLDKPRADFLSQYLNDLGVIIHHQFDLLLKETVFINTDWCVDGMYKILDSGIVKNGKFTASDLDQVWDEHRFAGKKAELLKLMHQYHLCFELRDNSGFIAPELLPPDKPQDLIWDHSSNLHFEYRYHFMPSGILSRFIVKSHGFIKDNIFWKHGVILEYEDTLALVDEDYINSKIKISLKGKNKKGLLSAIRMYIDEVHKDFDKSSKLNFEEMVPCNCGECSNADFPHFYKFKVLRKFETKSKKKVSCEVSSDDVLISSLIDDIQINSKDGRLKTSGDLRDFVLGIITGILEKEIIYKSSYVNFWRDSKFEEPKNEIEIQPYISNTLDHYCKFKGIQLSREVKEANGSVDILLSTRNDDNEILKVCIEIKKAHHADIETALNTQLPVYMKSVGTQAGIYLVVWLKNEKQPYPLDFDSIQELTETLEENNLTPDNIAVKVLNCCKQESPSKLKIEKS